MRVLLVEPYYGGSHQAWADGYAARSSHQVTLLTRPARFWKWRMHGSFLTLGAEVARHIEEHGRPDVILVSSMMNAASFAGAIRHVASGIPIAVYLHESQFTYPLSPADRDDQTYAMVNWSSAVTADAVIFNSAFHRDTFFEEVRRFLNVFPEDKHNDFIAGVEERSSVVPVGVEVSDLITAPRARAEPPMIVWNHRWEHDKGPDELLDIVHALDAAGTGFTMAMCGEVFVSVPPEFDEVIAALGDRLVHRGFADRDRYEEILRSADVVLSTAHQEFFGIGVVEGIAAGAHPVLPNRLVYPERVSALEGDPSTVLYVDAAHGAELITAAFDRRERAMREATARYDWSVVAPQLDGALEAM